MIEGIIVALVAVLIGLVVYKAKSSEKGDSSGTGTPANKNEADIDKH